jgi:hypothetical protein
VARNASLKEGVMGEIILRIPDDWSPELALAVRALLQQAIDSGCPIVTAIRGDAPADEIRRLQAGIRALVQELAHLAVPGTI